MGIWDKHPSKHNADAPVYHDLIEKVALEMYDTCYIGHIPWNKWRQFAKFAIEYKKREERMATKKKTLKKTAKKTAKKSSK
jgi:hypothetical protein